MKDLFLGVLLIRTVYNRSNYDCFLKYLFTIFSEGGGNIMPTTKVAMNETNQEGRKVIDEFGVGQTQLRHECLLRQAGEKAT